MGWVLEGWCAYVDVGEGYGGVFDEDLHGFDQSIAGDFSCGHARLLDFALGLDVRVSCSLPESLGSSSENVVRRGFRVEEEEDDQDGRRQPDDLPQSPPPPFGLDSET